jgi:RsiW-degrading membrane proteinase PrsW (M82 family)
MQRIEYMPPASGHANTIKWVVGVAASLFGLLLGLIVLLLIGVETGPVALLIGMVAATIPVPVYIVLLLWIDRYEAEPLWLLATAFFWGALVAVFVAIILNTIGSIVVAVLTSPQIGEIFGAVISAPIVEESSKGLFLFVLFFWKKDEFDDIVDGIVYAGMIGLGFAMTENIQYYGRAALQGSALPITLLIRGGFAPYSHPMFTSMTGIGLGWARQTTNSFIKWTAPVVGLALAMTLHAIWNGVPTFFGGVGFILAYLFVMVPVFAAILVVIAFGLRREARIIREQLYADCQRGLFSQPEYVSLCSIHGRLGASFNTLTTKGFGAWRARMQFHQMASELAFHRSRVARGIVTTQQAAYERETSYIRMLQDLRRQLSS